MPRHTVGTTRARFVQLISEYPLSQPVLPQLSGGTLDLSSPAIADEGAVLVKIPFYLQRDYGNRIMVEFFHPGRDTIRRYYYLQHPDDLGAGGFMTCRIEPLWALAEGDSYTISYTVVDRGDNRSPSQAITPVKIINTPASPFTSGGQSSLYGTYANGLVDSWVLAQDYTSNGVLWRSLGTSSTHAVLGFYRNSAEQPFLQLRCTDGTNWAYPSGFNLQPTVLSRNDLILLKLDSGSAQTVRLALTL